MKKTKTIVCFILMLVFISTTFSYAADDSVYLYDNKYPESSEQQNTRIDNNQELQGYIVEIVMLSMKWSHYCYHHSYTRYSTRNGKRYKITYVAAPKSKCWLCKAKQY